MDIDTTTGVLSTEHLAELLAHAVTDRNRRPYAEYEWQPVETSSPGFSVRADATRTDRLGALRLIVVGTTGHIGWHWAVHADGRLAAGSERHCPAPTAECALARAELAAGQWRAERAAVLRRTASEPLHGAAPGGAA